MAEQITPLSAPNRLVVVTGLPCTGKSTLATKMAARIRSAYLDKDDFQKCVLSRWDDSYMRQRESSYDCFFEVAGKNLAIGSSVVIDLPLPWRCEAKRQRAWVDRLKSLAAKAIARPKFIVCRPPVAVISKWMLQRNELRDRENMQRWAALSAAYDDHTILPFDQDQVRIVSEVPIDTAGFDILIQYCIAD